MITAALDMGTNSTRLLVARPHDDGSLDTFERLMTITRMGQGVGRIAATGAGVESQLGGSLISAVTQDILPRPVVGCPGRFGTDA